MNCIWRCLARQVNPLRALKPEISANIVRNIVCQHNVNIILPGTSLLHKNVFYNVIRSKSKKAKYESDDEQEIQEDDSSLFKDSKLVKFSTTSLRTDLILKSALGIARNKIEQQFYESKIRVNGKKIMKKSASGDRKSTVFLYMGDYTHETEQVFPTVINSVTKHRRKMLTSCTNCPRDLHNDWSCVIHIIVGHFRGDLCPTLDVKVGDELDIVKMVSPKNPDHLYVYRVQVLDVVAKEDSIAITARRFKNLLIENYEEDPYKGQAGNDA